jgi:short-subunit dehydrogenase
MELCGATVIITGASSGIGAAAARAFAAAGATVVLAARSVDALERLAAALPGNPLVVPTDVSVAAEAHHLVEETLAQRGPVDILVNNAGIGVIAPVELLAPADLERVLAVNLLGALHPIQAVVPSMRQRGQGHIINVSSVVGRYALPYAGGYAASKAALDRLTEALRIELRGSGIIVTLVCPGTTRTDFATRRMGQGRERRRMVPGGVAPEKVAAVLVRAAQRRPRVAYVTLRDRLQLGLSALAPSLVDRLLSWTFKWESK